MTDQPSPYPMDKMFQDVTTIGRAIDAGNAAAARAMAPPPGPSPRLLQILGLFREALGLMGLAAYAVEPGGPGARSRMLALRHRTCGHPVLTTTGATWRERGDLVALVVEALDHEAECRG